MNTNKDTVLHLQKTENTAVHSINPIPTGPFRGSITLAGGGGGGGGGDDSVPPPM